MGRGVLGLMWRCRTIGAFMACAGSLVSIMRGSDGPRDLALGALGGIAAFLILAAIFPRYLGARAEAIAEMEAKREKKRADHLLHPSGLELVGRLVGTSVWLALAWWAMPVRHAWASPAPTFFALYCLFQGQEVFKVGYGYWTRWLGLAFFPCVTPLYRGLLDGESVTWWTVVAIVFVDQALGFWLENRKARAFEAQGVVDAIARMEATNG